MILIPICFYFFDYAIYNFVSLLTSVCVPSFSSSSLSLFSHVRFLATLNYLFPSSVCFSLSIFPIRNFIYTFISDTFSLNKQFYFIQRTILLYLTDNWRQVPRALLRFGSWEDWEGSRGHDACLEASSRFWRRRICR